MIELPHISLAFFVHLKLKVAAIMLSLVGEIGFIAISVTVSIETVVAHHLQNVSGKSGWKVNGARFFGTFQRKIAHKAVMSLSKKNDHSEGQVKNSGRFSS